MKKYISVLALLLVVLLLFARQGRWQAAIPVFALAVLAKPQAGLLAPLGIAALVRDVRKNEKARKPAYQLEVDFGDEIGIKKSSAQITDYYTPEALVGKQVLAVVNFPPRQIANFFSEVLVLGTYSEGGVVLIRPDKEVKNGDKLG